MTEATKSAHHARQLKQAQVDTTPEHKGIISLRKESEHTSSTESFVPSSYDDTVTVNSSTTSFSPRLNAEEEEDQILTKEEQTLLKETEHQRPPSLSCSRGSFSDNGTTNRPSLDNSPARDLVREEEDRVANRVGPISTSSVGSVNRSGNLSRLSSSSSGGSLTVTVQVVRPCPVKKGPAPAAVTILSPLPVQCAQPSPVETTSATVHTKPPAGSQQQHQTEEKQQVQQREKQQQQQRQEAALKAREQEEFQRRQQHQQQLEEARRRQQQQQLEEAAAKRHQKALEQEEARRRQQQIQQEELRKRLQQQQQLQTQQRQREAALAKLKEQQQREKEEAKRRQANQCAFPTREPQQQQQQQQTGRPSGMGSSDRGMPHSAHVQIAGRQAANGAVRENGGAKYHPPPSQQHQHQQVRHNVRTISSDTASGIKTPHGSIDLDSSVAGAPPPAPLFERIVSEEVQELKEYARIIENQSARLAELQRIHDDLEHRLEMQTKDRMELEATLEKRERMWAGRCEGLEKERDQWKSMVQVERTKNERLLDQVYRKDKEIHRMIQRKYDSDRHQPHGHSHHANEGIRAVKRAASERGASHQQAHGGKTSPGGAERSNSTIHHKSPQEILAASGSVEAVRERNVTNSLLDFFGM